MTKGTTPSRDSFDDWLKARHDKMSTPFKLIDTYVKKAVNSPIASVDRLVIGQMNEVYDVTTKDDQNIIVRISPEHDPRFEAERWALDASRRMGVPTPKVFLVEKTSFNKKKMTFCIEEKLPGQPLDHLLKDKKSKLDNAIKQIGSVLSKIHQVKVNGFGYLQPDGKGWEITFSSIMLDLIEKQDELFKASAKWGVPRSKVKKGLALLTSNTDLYNWDKSSLTHGDFGPPHILVNNDTITGIIDMQECSGNHPIFDFVHWETSYGKDIPLKKLKDSYLNKSLFDENFEPLFNLVLLRQCLWMLLVHIKHKNPHGIDVFKRGIDKALKFFSNGKSI